MKSKLVEIHIRERQKTPRIKCDTLIKWKLRRKRERIPERKGIIKDNFRSIRFTFSPLRGGRCRLRVRPLIEEHPYGLDRAHIPKVGLP